jgi:hypothetical protein
MAKEPDKTVWVRCKECGNDFRNHRVLFEHKNTFEDGDGGWSHDICHQLIECMGCECIRYRRYSMSQERTNEYHEHVPHNISVFPDDGGDTLTRSALDFGNDDDFVPLVPENVVKMYRETVTALNSGARTLAGGGLRATVEAICLAQGITTGNLQKKIDALDKQNLLTKAQADLLHEERYIGNAALHELATPSKSDIEDGLQIVEVLINTIYVLPAKAKRLREVREASAKKNGAKSTSAKKPSTKKN